MYLLGYIPKENCLYLGDMELNVVSYVLVLSVLEYQTAVMRKDFSTADKVLPTIPREQRIRVAYFLEEQVQSYSSFSALWWGFADTLLKPASGGQMETTHLDRILVPLI